MQAMMSFGTKVFQPAGIIINKIAITHQQAALLNATISRLASLLRYSISAEKARLISAEQLVFTVQVHKGGQTAGALPAVAQLPFKDLPSTSPFRFAISRPQAPTVAVPRG